MTHKDPYIEQLRQELLSQDPSLSSQKKEYIGLITRMSSHIPKVEIDKDFQNNLKSRLEYHIQHTTSSQITQPAKNLNRLARFISYGLPTIALGVIIFLALPGTPNQVIAPTETYTIDATSGELIRVDTSTVGTSTSSQTQSNSNDNNNSAESINNDNSETNSDVRLMMEPTSSATIQEDSNLSSDIQSPSSPAPKQSDNTLQERKSQIFTDDNFTISYRLESVGDDIILKGTITDGLCRMSYNFSKNLSGTHKDASVTILATGEENSSANFTIDFQDNNIVNIQGKSICTKDTSINTTTKDTQSNTR